jgi:octaprenyl-diphosphate synthase
MDYFTMKDLTYATFLEGMRSRLEVFENRLLLELKKYNNHRIYEPLLFALSNGKRIRPLLLLLSFESVGGKSADPIPLAGAIELLHTESLIHDDVIDSSKIRRGKPSFSMRYGPEIAMLSSDFLLASVLEIISKYKKTTILTKELSKVSIRMCEGELEEMEIKPNEISWEAYIRIIENKTASLFEASTKLGAMLGKGTEEEVKALSKYGMLFGVAYQLIDDIADGKAERNHPLSFLTKQSDRMRKLTLNYIENAEKQLESLRKSEAKRYLLKMPRLLFEKRTVQS